MKKERHGLKVMYRLDSPYTVVQEGANANTA